MGWRWLLLVPVAALAACADDDDGAAATPASEAVGPVVTTTPPAPSADGSSTPETSAETVATVPEDAVVPRGFEAQAARVTAADGAVCDVCLWVAATTEERGRGLMGVTDLGGADGMVFVWDEPTRSQFWMRDTPTPLSIAFFDDGQFVSSADMEPCLTGPDDACARYPAAAPYTAAIEVFLGGLDDIAVGAGSRLELLDLPCDPAA